MIIVMWVSTYVEQQYKVPDSKVHEAHVGPITFAIWGNEYITWKKIIIGKGIYEKIWNHQLAKNIWKCIAICP